MALEGDLSEFPLTDIIQLVDLAKQTGGVEIDGVRSGQHFNGWLYFRDGKIIGAELPGHTPLRPSTPSSPSPQAHSSSTTTAS